MWSLEQERTAQSVGQPDAREAVSLEATCEDLADRAAPLGPADQSVPVGPLAV